MLFLGSFSIFLIVCKTLLYENETLDVVLLENHIITPEFNPSSPSPRRKRGRQREMEKESLPIEIEKRNKSFAADVQ